MSNPLEPVLASLRLLSPRQKSVYFALVSGRVVANLLDVAGIAGVALFGTMIAARISGRNQMSFGGIAISTGDSALLLWVIVGIVGLFLLKSALATVLLRANGFFLAKVEADASREVAEYLFGEDSERVRRHSVAQIQWAVTSSTSMAFSNLLTNFNVLIAESSLFLFVFVAFAIADFQTAIVVTVYFLLLLVAFQLVINRRLVKAGDLLTSSSKKSTQSLLDLTKAFKELLVLSKVPRFVESFATHRFIEARTFARVRFFDGSPRFFVESALMFGVLALVGWQFLRGDLEAGLTSTAVFMAGGVRMMGALLPLQNALSWMRVHGPQALDAQVFLHEARREAESSKDSGKPRHSLPGKPVLSSNKSSSGVDIEIQKVWFKYSDAYSYAIRALTLSIPAGSQVALVGPSGAGKTTIADLVLGVITPSRGSVRIDGVPPAEFRDRNIGAITYVPQRPGMVQGSFAENVAIGEEPAAIDTGRVSVVLGQVGLLDEMKRLNLNIWSDLGAHSDNLSGGQLQRIGLARALYPRPRLLVLDEATSALDAGSEAEIGKYVAQLRGKVTTIIIAHRLSTIQKVDTVFVVDKGKVVESGTFKEVRQKNQLIESYIELMSFDE